GYGLRFERISLLRGKLGLRSDNAGEVINGWIDRHPEREGVSFTVLTRAHQPTECWLLSKGPREGAPEILSRSLRLSVWLRRLAALALVTTITSVVLVIGAVTHTGPWIDSFALLSGILGTAWLLRKMPARSRSNERQPGASSPVS